MENNKITSVSVTINTKQTNKTQQDCSPPPSPKDRVESILFN